MHPIIESVSEAWKIVPLSVLPVEHEVAGARWLCTAGKDRKPYSSPPLNNIHVLSLILRTSNVHCWVDGETFYQGRVPANRLRIVPAGNVGSWVADSAVEMFHIYIPDAALRRRLSVLGYRCDAASSLLLATNYVSDPLLQNLMQRLAVTVRAGGKLQEQYLGTLSDALMLHLLSYYAKLEPGSPEPADLQRLAIDAAIDEIAGNLAIHIDSQTLASNAGVSVAQFTRNFQKATGLTPHQYRLHRRIEVAKEKLKAGGDSLATIADELGFADQAHFTRTFKQFAGVTPGEFSTVFRRSTDTT
jgi:AraC-like DNA-binding protein